MTVRIQGRSIGVNYPPYIVAEIGASHNGSLDRFIELMLCAQRIGVDAVKFQAFTPDTITIDTDRDGFVIKDGPWRGYRLYDLYKKAHTPREWFPKMHEVAKEFGITLFPSVFSPEDVDYVMRFDPPALKISSFEIVDPILIRHAARTGRPLMISMGMASGDEIEEAMNVAFEYGRSEPIMMHCASKYPARISDFDLSALDPGDGLSDHTMGHDLAVAAVAYEDISVIEKHLTTDRSEGGLDDGFASEPHEFAAMIAAVRAVYEARKFNSDVGMDQEHSSLRRSLYVVQDMKAGDKFTPENLRSIRPGYGLSVIEYDDIIGKNAVVDIERGTPMSWELFE